MNNKTLRPWGWFQTLSFGNGTKTKHIAVMPGHRLSLQKHEHRSEHWIVTQGHAYVTVGKRDMQLHPGDHCDIAIGEVHRLANPGADMLEIVEVQFGSYLGEDDIVRLEDDYGQR